MSEDPRFALAISRIDAANGDDPTTLSAGNVSRPKELVHADMLTRWVGQLRPFASDELLLAARGHHIRRWLHPRSEYPDGREGYLRWRTTLYRFHAEQVGAILLDCGYDEKTVDRVRELVGKRALRREPEAQALEDGLCLVFMETQFQQLNDRVADEKMIEVLRKTWRKMSPSGREFALSLQLPAHQRQLVEFALAVG